MLVVGNDRQYERFCEAIGRPDLFADERFGSIAGRLNHREILEAEVIAELRKRPREEWVQVLRDAGVPAGAVRTPMEAVVSPEALGREMIQPVEYNGTTQDVVGSPFHLSKTPVRKPGRVPLHGEDTDSVLSELLGYSAEHIAKVRGG